MEEILSLKKSFLEELKSANSLSELQQLKVKYLGKKGLVTTKLKTLSSVPPELRPEYGKAVNEIKNFAEEELKNRETLLKTVAHKRLIESEAIDTVLTSIKERKIS